MVEYKSFTSPYHVQGEPECFVGELKRGLDFVEELEVRVPIMKPIQIDTGSKKLPVDIISVSEIIGKLHQKITMPTRSYPTDARASKTP